MNLKALFVVVGLLIPTVITAQKYTNETWRAVDVVYNQCDKVVRTFPVPILDVSQHMLESFATYSYKLEILANCENSTILSDGSVMLLNYLGLFQCLKDSPANMLVQFCKELRKISTGLRQIVSSQQAIIGKLSNHINDEIECLECSLRDLLNEFLNNGLDNLAHCKKSHFGPVMSCVQNLTDTIAQIAKTILNDPHLFNDDVVHSMTILCIILDHCFSIVQGTHTTLACLIYSKTKRVPRLLNSCLHEIDTVIVGLTNRIRSLAIDYRGTFRNLLEAVGEVSDSLRKTLENGVGVGPSRGVILNSERITQHLTYRMSTMN